MARQERKEEHNDPHKLIHVISGSLAGAGLGLLAGFVALQIFIDLLDYVIGPFYVGNATAFLGLIGAALAGLQVGLFCSRGITRFLREAGTVASWLFLIGLGLFAALVFRQGYMLGLLPTHSGQFIFFS